MTTSIYDGGNFYVYLITDLNPTSTARYYIGSRTRKTLVERNTHPEDDLYMGTSSHSDMIQGLKERPNDFEKVIIEIHNDKDDCLIAEEWFQRHHFAVENEEFFNKVYANSKCVTNDESIKKRSKTVNDPKWKATVGVEAKKKQSETKNDPEWKATVGVEAKRKRSETVSDPNWLETTGEYIKSEISKVLNDPEWKATIGVQQSKNHSNTRNDPEWKATVGVEAKRKEQESKNDPHWKATIGTEAKKKQSETKNDPHWKATVGVEAKRKRSETVSDPNWIEVIGKKSTRKRLNTINNPKWRDTIGKQATASRHRKMYKHRNIGFRELGPFKTSTELKLALLDVYNSAPSESLINNLAYNQLNVIVTGMYSPFLKALNEDVIGKTWAELGFYYYES